MASAYPSLRWWLLPFVRSRIWTVRGLEHLPTEGGFILAPNHQSWIDSPILAAAVYRSIQKPLRFVAQSTKWKLFGGLPIDQNNRASVLDRAVEAVLQGHPVVIFPEGNSNTDPELRMAKTGVARLALRTGLPVIPVGIKGTRGISFWRSLIWFFSLVYPCHIEIGTPLHFPKTELDEHESVLLTDTTATILREISVVSGKSMPGEGAKQESHGIFWFIVWRLFRPLVQWRVRVYGIEHLPDRGPFIIAANHASYFDAPALSMAVFHAVGIQPMFPTKASVAEAFKNMLGQGGWQALGMLPLDMTDKSKVLQTAIDYLHRDGVIGIFPEGQRNKPSVNPNWQTEILKGKTGAVRLHIATGAPIIPVTIKAPKGLGIIEAVLKGLLPWKFTRVTFGPAMQLTNVPNTIETATKEDLERLTRQLMRTIATMSGLTYTY